MAHLDVFNQQDQILLVALPYRVGMWVSESDVSGGNEAQDAEIRSLEGIIMGFAEDMCKSEFVEELMKLTLTHKDKWPEWRDNLDKVPEECAEAVGIIETKMTDKDVETFSENIFEIAHSVAMAYREYNDPQFSKETLSIYVRYWIDHVKARMRGAPQKTIVEYFNISKEEREALQILLDNLRVPASVNYL